jgi:hypothetical protein
VRQIWFCNLGKNIGYEQNVKGKDFLRPVIILKKFNNEIFWAIPLTKSKKKDMAYYFTFVFKNNKNTAILSQLRMIDAKRLSYIAGKMSLDDFIKLTKKLKALFP